MDTLERLIQSCGKYFVSVSRQLNRYTATGIFKLGKLGKDGLYKGPSQEVRYFEADTPLAATQKLYYELKKHYEEEFNPSSPEDPEGEDTVQDNQAGQGSPST